MTEQPRQGRVAPPPIRRTPPAAQAPDASRAKGGGRNRKVTKGLVALSSAAILSVYGIGYVRTNASPTIHISDAPTVPVATAVASTMNATPSPIATYRSPLFPTPTAASGDTTHGAATATTIPPTATAAAPVVTSGASAPARYKDGTYTGTGTSRHGNITASVLVQGGKIISADITQCGTRYPCADIADLPGQVVTRQSAAVDLVSGATDSSHAYQGAIREALAKATVAA